MNITARLKKSKSLKKLKQLQKIKSNENFLSAHKAVASSEKNIFEKQKEINNSLIAQQQHLNNKYPLDPSLMQMYLHHLSVQHGQLDALLENFHIKHKDLDNKRVHLAKSITQEKVFEKLVSKLEMEQFHKIIKAEAIHHENSKTMDENLTK